MTAMRTRRSTRAKRALITPPSFADFIGPQVPDPITFIIGKQWLDRTLYIRQATLVKVVFLRIDLLTPYDYEVIAEWEESFRFTGNNGITIGILDRMVYLKAHGYRWFREVLLVLGRRAGKGYLIALCMAYILWCYLATGNPQKVYEIARDKKIDVLIYAGKKKQATDNLYRDLANAILGGPCFTPYVNKPLGESLSLFAPNDRIRMAKLARRGIETSMDMATFSIQPREATLMSGRGGASAIIGFDEFAHVVATGANRSAEEIYTTSTPSLDQFGKDAFIGIPSSPWQMIGMFYKLWEQAQELNPDGSAVYPERFFLQLASWEIYTDWQRNHLIDLFPPDFTGDLGEYTDVEPPRLTEWTKPVQAYDEAMQRLEKSDPDTFAVERLCLDPATRVLTSDLRWVAIKDIEIGDELIGIDEIGPEKTLGKSPQRKLRASTVEAKCTTIGDKPLRLTFDDGTQVVCSRNHRWFADTPSGHTARWIPAGSFKPGYRIRRIADVWSDDQSRAAGYLAGIYDGEGSLIHRYEVSATRTTGSEFCINFDQNPNEALDQTLEYLHLLDFKPEQVRRDRRNQRYKITGLDECLRFLGQVRPQRLLAKCRYMWENHSPRGTDRKYKTIIKIEDLPTQELVDLQTSTKTFIAEGLVSHNSHWQATIDAYLDPRKIALMFSGPLDEDGQSLREPLQMHRRGLLSRYYKGHVDPSLVNDNFAVAIAHTEPGEDGWERVVFDWLGFWDPADFPDHTINYVQVEEELWELVSGFPIDNLTFDQHNSASIISHFNERIRKARLPKRVSIGLETATAPHNLKVAESFKMALNQGWIECPYFEQADLELRFLQFKNGKVVHQDTGPVVHDDVARCMMEVVDSLLSSQIVRYLTGGTPMPITGTSIGGNRPWGLPATEQDTATFGQLRQAAGLRRGEAAHSPSRGRPPVSYRPGYR